MNRKIIAFILIVLFVLSSAACGGKTEDIPEGSVETAEEIDPSGLPDGFGDFIARFYRYSDKDFGKEYDCTEAAGSNILLSVLIKGGCADWNVYGMLRPEYHNRENDPAGRQTGEGYQIVAAQDADRIVKEIFHASEEDIDEMRKAGDGAGEFYVTEGSDGSEYYVILNMMGAGDNAMKITARNVRYDGERYYVVYDRCAPDAFTPPGAENEVYGQGYAVMGYDDGLWNMYFHSMTIPDLFGTEE